MPKNIVICCDGTSNEYGLCNTNVFKLYSILEKSNAQYTYYGPGIGTLSAPSMWSKVGKETSKLAGLAFGVGILKDIETAYTYLMNCYEKGDKVFIFGFSRGAFTARAVAALIAKCGLLNKGNENLVPYATKMFRYERKPEIYRGFRKAFSRPCTVHFLGLWDTVKSVGWIYDPISFQFTANNLIVRTIRHALAIDECRSFFRQNLWSKGRSFQDIKQVWFPGTHSDVGGGFPSDESGPSDIALDWMIKQARPDLRIEQSKLSKFFPKDEISISNPIIHESLKGWWKILEYIPRSYFDPAKNWKKRWKIYGGEHRHISEGSIIHQSVIDRITLSNYNPSNLPKKYFVEPW